MLVALTRLSLLLLLAFAGPAAAQVPTQQVTLPGPEGVALRAVLALPTGPARAAPIIALHGCSGLGGASAPPRLPARERDWAARLTAAGHPVLFPDSFGSRELGPACGVRGFPAAAETLRWQDARAAAAWANAQAWAIPGGAVLLGWSHGGSTALAAVAQPLPPGLIRAAIAFYPGCGATQRAGGWTAAVPLLLLLGESDDWTSARFCQQLGAGQPGLVEIETYPGAHHGFDAPGGQLRSRLLPNGLTVTTGPDPAAREAALARTAGFLLSHGQ